MNWKDRLQLAHLDPTPENLAAVVAPADFVAARPPAGHSWVPVMTDNRISGWRLTTPAEEKRSAEQRAMYASTASDVEANVTTEDDFEEAFGRGYGDLWEEILRMGVTYDDDDNLYGGPWDSEEDE